MIKEAHIPKRPPIEKRALGATEYRKGHMDADAMQNQSGGKRYNLSVTKKLAEEDTPKALNKAAEKKAEREQVRGRTMTGQRPDPINIDPEKRIQGQGLQL